MPKKPEEDQYVTKAEFDEAMGMINRSFDKMATKKQLQVVADDVAVLKDDMAVLKDDVAVLKDDMKEVKSTLTSLLNIVQEIDAQLKEHRDLPERVTRLEEDSFKHEIAIRQLKNK